MLILVTGCAGFIGSHVVRRLIEQGHKVVGIDNLDSGGDEETQRLQLGRLFSQDLRRTYFHFYLTDITRPPALEYVFTRHTFDAVIHLAAKAGVRRSCEKPEGYISTNVQGTLAVLEAVRRHGVGKFILASTSSLYAGHEAPFREDLPVDQPRSPYAASKLAAEGLAHTYHHLYGLNVTVLRYFTVYGPAGRPDMAPYKFMRLIDEGKEVPVYGDGTQRRDFTYVDDIAEGTIRALRLTGHQVINLGSHGPHQLRVLVRFLEEALGKKARLKFLPPDPADMQTTHADIERAEVLLGWKPTIGLEEGVGKMVEWWKSVGAATDGRSENRVNGCLSVLYRPRRGATIKRYLVSPRGTRVQ